MLTNSLSNINLYRFFDISCTHRGSGQYEIGNFELPSGSQLLFAAITYNGNDFSQKVQLRFGGITQEPQFNDSTGGDTSKEYIAIGFNTSTKSTQVHLYMQTSFILDQTSTASILAIRIQN